jgi:hypothetical protein
MTFLHKTVGGSETQFGCDLRDLRDLHGISIEQACKETKIDSDILNMLEEDRILAYRDPLFLKRHLMTYVRYLGGYEPYFSGRFDAILKERQSVRTAKDLLPRERSVRFWDLFVAPQFLAFLGILFLAGLLTTYVIWQAHAVSTPPLLEITSPVDGVRLESSRVIVSGRTMPEATLSVNGQSVAVDEDGNFSIQLDVHRGTNVIRMIAKRRRGSETVLERRVIFDRAMPDFNSATTSTKTGL